MTMHAEYETESPIYIARNVQSAPATIVCQRWRCREEYMK